MSVDILGIAILGTGYLLPGRYDGLNSYCGSVIPAWTPESSRHGWQC